MVLILLEMQDEADKTEAIDTKGDKAVMHEHILKKRETHKRKTLVLKVAENGLGIKQEKHGDEKVPAGCPPPGDTVSASDGEAEA